MKPTHFYPVRALVFLCLSVFFLPGCTPPTTHLKITALSASPEPKIGQVVTVHTEIVSAEDEPDATIHFFLPQGVKLIGGSEPSGGETRWQGSLTANRPQCSTSRSVYCTRGTGGLM
ncbi:MAG: hypothetical protein ACOYYS_26125 [Chloroflexota bacterium]